MKRGENPEFKIGGIQSLFRRNWDICIDSHEIDLDLSYGENFAYLMDKYVYHNICLDDLI